MADIQIWALRDLSTKELMGWSLDPFTVQSGQEQVQVTIDESDFGRFNVKYRFDSGGSLEINGKDFYKVTMSEDAVDHHPIDGVPQLDADDGVSYFTVSLQKKDIDNNNQTAASDNDTIYFSRSGGQVVIKDDTGTNEITTIDLVNGAASFRVYSELSKRRTTISLMSSDLTGTSLTVETK